MKQTAKRLLCSSCKLSRGVIAHACATTFGYAHLLSMMRCGRAYDSASDIGKGWEPELQAICIDSLQTMEAHQNALALRVPL